LAFHHVKLVENFILSPDHPDFTFGLRLSEWVISWWACRHIGDISDSQLVGSRDRLS